MDKLAPQTEHFKSHEANVCRQKALWVFRDCILSENVFVLGGHFQNIRFHLMFSLKRNIVPGYLSNIKFVCQNVVNSGAVKRIAFFRAKAISFAFRAIAVIPSWQEPYWEYKNLTILYLTDKCF